MIRVNRGLSQLRMSVASARRGLATSQYRLNGLAVGRERAIIVRIAAVRLELTIGRIGRIAHHGVLQQVGKVDGARLGVAARELVPEAKATRGARCATRHIIGRGSLWWLVQTVGFLGAGVLGRGRVSEFDI